MNTVEIALFPIPGSVTLPYSSVPLHIFEPRYRKMIKDSIQSNRKIGVSHTKRVLGSKKNQVHLSLEEHLNTNHESYEAYPIFSAGFAELLETLPDGRMVVQIKMDSRYEIIEEIQQVPYQIVLCKEYLDLDSSLESEVEIQNLRSKLDKLFMSIVLKDTQKSEMLNFLTSPDWQNMTTEEYSFAIYSLVLFDPETMQSILEMNSPLERIKRCQQTLSLLAPFEH